MNWLRTGFVLSISLLSFVGPLAFAQTPTERFWDSNRLVPVPLGRQSDVKPGEIIVLQGGTPLYYEPSEALATFPIKMEVPYSKTDTSFELGVFAKIFGFSPSLKFKDIDSLTVEPAKMSGLQYHDGDVDQKLLPTVGDTATKKFLADKTYATVYMVTAVLNTAHLKITENHGRSIALTSGPDVAGCTLPQPDTPTHGTDQSATPNAPAEVGTPVTDPTTPKKIATDSQAAAKKAKDEAAASAKANTDAAASKGTVVPAVDTPGGGGSICQSKQGVVEVNTPEGVAVVMRVYRLWWSNTDQSWNLAMDKYKDLPKF